MLIVGDGGGDRLSLSLSSELAEDGEMGVRGSLDCTSDTGPTTGVPGLLDVVFRLPRGGFDRLLLADFTDAVSDLSLKGFNEPVEVMLDALSLSFPIFDRMDPLRDLLPDVLRLSTTGVKGPSLSVLLLFKDVEDVE